MEVLLGRAANDYRRLPNQVALPKVGAEHAQFPRQQMLTKNALALSVVSHKCSPRSVLPICSNMFHMSQTRSICSKRVPCVPCVPSVFHLSPKCVPFVVNVLVQTCSACSTCVPTVFYVSQGCQLCCTCVPNVPACVPHVFHMCSKCVPIVSQLYSMCSRRVPNGFHIIHLCSKYAPCVPHVFHVSYVCSK